MVRRSLGRLGVKTVFIEPRSPWDCRGAGYGQVDRFSEAGLQRELQRRAPQPPGRSGSVLSLSETRVLISAWRRHYITVRPNSALGYRAPAPEAMTPSGRLAPWSPSGLPVRECGGLRNCSHRITGARDAGGEVDLQGRVETGPRRSGQDPAQAHSHAGAGDLGGADRADGTGVTTSHAVPSHRTVSTPRTDPPRRRAPPRDAPPPTPTACPAPPAVPLGSCALPYPAPPRCPRRSGPAESRVGRVAGARRRRDPAAPIRRRRKGARLGAPSMPHNGPWNRVIAFCHAAFDVW